MPDINPDILARLDRLSTQLTKQYELATKLDGASVYSAVWVEQSRGMEVKTVSGFIASAQTGDGVVAVHGSTAMGALRTLVLWVRYGRRH